MAVTWTSRAIVSIELGVLDRDPVRFLRQLSKAVADLGDGLEQQQPFRVCQIPESRLHSPDCECYPVTREFLLRTQYRIQSDETVGDLSVEIER